MARLGKLDRAVRLARLGELCGREVGSTNDLTRVEAAKVIAALEAVEAT